MKPKQKFFGSLTSPNTKNIFLIIFIPILIVLVLSYVGNVYYANHYNSVLLSMYSNEFGTFLKSADSSYSDVRNEISVLLSVPDVSDIAYTDEPVESLTPSLLSSVQNSLSSAKLRTQYTDNIAVVNRSAGFVVSTDGILNIENYFNDLYSYSSYGLDYWLDYRSFGGSARCLPATSVSKNKSQSSFPIVPVVYPVTGADNNSLIIFNIDVQKLYSAFSDCRFTENSLMYITDAEQKPIYATNTDIPDISELKKEYESSLYYFAKCTNGYILSTNARGAAFGCGYLVYIPMSDMKGNSVPMILLLIGILLLLVTFVFILIKTKLSRQDSATLFSSSGQENAENSLPPNTVNLPQEQKRYLVDMLNNPVSAYDVATNKQIFKHDYFVSVAVNISLKQSASDEIVLNPHLYDEVYKAITSLFSAEFLTYSLPSTNNTLYLLLNTESKDCTDKLNNIIIQTRELLSADAEYIDLFIGKGNVYEGIDGLRLSHQEALSEIFKEMNSDKVQIFDNRSLHDYSFSVYNENILVNYILTGHSDDAKRFIQDSFTSCSKSSDDTKRQIYTGIFNALVKVVKIKKLRVPDFENRTDSEVLNNILSRSDEAVLSYMSELVENISSLDASGQSTKIADIAEYIHEHYTEELYLDALAQMFDTTPKYLSKALKLHLGIPFKTYLTQLRIGKAEELLMQDDVKINDICKLTGFMTHSSFIRAFKQKNGISPSEYRNLYYKKNNIQTDGDD